MNDVKIIHHNLYTNGIAYLRLLFNLKELLRNYFLYLFIILSSRLCEYKEL